MVAFFFFFNFTQRLYFFGIKVVGKMITRITIMLVLTRTGLCLDELVLSTRAGQEVFGQQRLVNLNISVALLTENKAVNPTVCVD